MNAFFRFLLTVAVIFLLPQIIPSIEVASVYTALVVAVLLGLLNITLRPILLFLTLPITILTFGLFALVVNGAMLWLLSTVVKGFEVGSFWAAVLAAALISLVGYLARAR